MCCQLHILCGFRPFCPSHLFQLHLSWVRIVRTQGQCIPNMFQTRSSFCFGNGCAPTTAGSVMASRDNTPSLMLEVRSKGKRREVGFVGFLYRLGQVGSSMSGRYSEFQVLISIRESFPIFFKASLSIGIGKHWAFSDWRSCVFSETTSLTLFYSNCNMLGKTGRHSTWAYEVTHPPWVIATRVFRTVCSNIHLDF